MSYDRVSLNSAGFSGEHARKSNARTKSERLDSAATTGLGIGAVSAGSSAAQYGIGGNPLMQKWGDNFTTWSTRTALADMTDNVLSKKKGTSAAATVGTPASPHSYSSLFKLDDKSVQLSKFNLKDFKSAVKTNISQVGKQPGGLLKEGTTLKGYLKNTVVGENVKPVKQLLTNSPDKKIGAGIGRLAGLAYIGHGVLGEGKAAYQKAKAQEDGSLKSKIHTWTSTAGAVVKKAAKSAVSWEAAGAAFAIGKAILPIAAGGIPLGGILIGALGGALANTMLDKVSPDVKPPEEKEKGDSPLSFGARG